MARQYLRLTPETTWGQYDPNGTPVIVQLDRDNAFTMRPQPIRWTIRSAGGFNRRVQTGSSKTQCRGNLNTLVYGSQAAALLNLCVASGGNVLPSATIDQAIVMDDAAGTTVYRRYLGAMVQQAQLAASEPDPLLRLQLQLIAQKPAAITATDFPEPHASDYPDDAPYVFEMAAGAFTLGSSRAEFERFQLTIKNLLDARYMASPYLTRCKYVGRDINFSCVFPYVTTVDRASFESVTAAAAALTFTNAGHSLGVNFNGRNYYADVEDDLALDKIHLQNIELESFFDPNAAVASDIAVTVT